MRIESEGSPYSFLTALTGERPIDREIIAATRAMELKIAAHMILSAKVSTLYAFSGNGKSSLINAGLVPYFLDLGYVVFRTRPRPPYAPLDPVAAFKEGCIRDHHVPALKNDRAALVEEAVRQLETLPSDALPGVRRLIDRVASEQTPPPSDTRGPDLGLHLREHLQAPLVEFLTASHDVLGPSVPIIVICDQFEELFVHYYNSPLLKAFVRELRDVCDAPQLQVHILFSMREDWVGSMVTLRDMIPDVLNCVYRLDPMRVSAAPAALTRPAESVGITIPASLATRVLDDLAAFYRHQQRTLGAAHLTPSEIDDPFIELPALQIVGERLWSRKPANAAVLPESVYTAMMPAFTASKAGSPAAALLDTYLLDTLSAIDAPDGNPALHDLRLDFLYLLTDKTVHRRALGERELLAELKLIRSAAGVQEDGEPDVGMSQLHAALEPLLARRLLRIDAGPSQERHYELTHDFVVRSIVRAWNALDRERAQQQALRKEQQRLESDRLQALSEYVQRGVYALTGLTGALFVALCAVGLILHPSREAEPFTGFVLACVASVAMALIAQSVVLRNKVGVLFGIIACIAPFSAMSVESRWPQPTLTLNQWIVALLALVPALRSCLSRTLADSPERLDVWRSRTVWGVDYALYAIIVAVARSWAVLAAFLAVPACFVVQSLVIAITRETLGEIVTRRWIVNTPAAPETPPGPKFLRVILLGGGYIAGWIFLLMGTDTDGSPFYPFGNPFYVLLHIGALFALIRYTGDRSSADETAPDRRPSWIGLR
jgi:hypothetical protein